MRELVVRIRHHDHQYYALDAPEISDAAYDELFRDLQRLEEAHPELRQPDSPAQRIGTAPLDGFPTVRHTARMYSLDSAGSEEALYRFDTRLRKAVGDAADVRYVLEPKLDGASVELVYKRGVLARASTRGDGERGEGITENVRTIRSVPLRLRDDTAPVPPMVAVRGEVMMRIDAFERLNERLVAQGRAAFANPRNAAAGGLRQLDPAVTARRPLELYAYDVLAADGLEAATHREILETLRAWGLPVNDLFREAVGPDEILAFHRELEAGRDDLGYEIDGLVVKLDDLAARERVGSTARHPRWAFAFKFPPRREVTRVIGIVPSVGRTGKITPVALMRPVELSGVTVSRATLHNREEVARKDIREGDRVRVQRAGDVIPQVVERIEEADRERGSPFRMPDQCPSCGTRLVERGPFTVCPNAFDCPAQLVGRLAHFGSRDALDIEGLGEETARLLVSEGLVRSLPALFELQAEQLLSFEGFGERSAGKLVQGIRKAADVELPRFLYGLGIPEVGTTVARTLAAHFGSLNDVRVADEEALAKVGGVGPRMAELIRAFFTEPHNAEMLDLLLNGAVRVGTTKAETASVLEGVAFVFTGGLLRLTRREAAGHVEALGGRVTSAVSGETNYVVAGENAGSKLARAEALGVEVLDEDGFVTLLRSHGADVG